MKNNFMALMNEIYEEEFFSDSIIDSKDTLIKKISELNKFYSLCGTREEFRHSFVDSGLPCAPVPFITSGEVFDFVVLGLNPGFEESDNIKEKMLASFSWEDYSKFYNSLEIFDLLVGDKVSSYFINIFIIFNSLRLKKFTKWSEYFKGIDKKEKSKKYLEIISNYPIAVAEMVPFHSERFGSINVNDLYQNFPYLKKYFNSLLDVIVGNMSDEGWILVNGKAVSEVFVDILKDEIKIILDNKKEGYSLGVLKNKKVIILHEFLRRQSGKLNSYSQIEKMLETIINYNFPNKNL